MDDNTDGKLGSRLPEDPAYWDELNRRILARSGPLLESRGARRTPWRNWLAELSPALAAAAVLALAVAWGFAGPFAAVDPDMTLPLMGQAIVPDDPMARTLLADSIPPSIGRLSGWTMNNGGIR